MQSVGRPKLSRPLPKALPRTAVEALLETVAQDRDSQRQTDWAERDLAIILTARLAGLRADELCRSDIGDIRTTPDGGAAVIRVKGKGGKERSVPIEAELLSVIDEYLVSLAVRFPGTAKRKANVACSSHLAMVNTIPAVCRPRWRTNHPRSIAIARQEGVPTRGPDVRLIRTKPHPRNSQKSQTLRHLQRRRPTARSKCLRGTEANRSA
jgi:integrase